MSEKPTYEELEKKVLQLEEIELELKKTEMLLKDEINWRRLVIEESRDAIVVLDHNANVYEANNRFNVLKNIIQMSIKKSILNKMEWRFNAN